MNWTAVTQPPYLLFVFGKRASSACSIVFKEVSYSNLFPLYFIPKASLPASSALVPISSRFREFILHPPNQI